MSQYYTMVDFRSEGFLKDRGSKFYAYALPVQNEHDISNALETIKKEHPKARHHCFAFRLGETGEQTRANDDGEPSGTAGKPILGQLVKFNLTNTIIIVVRYFGGTKLGVSGLINAYRGAAASALEGAPTKTFLIGDQYMFRTDYSLGASLVDNAKRLEMKLLHQEFGEKVTFMLLVPREDGESKIMKLLQQLTHLDYETIEEYSRLIEVQQQDFTKK